MSQAASAARLLMSEVSWALRPSGLERCRRHYKRTLRRRVLPQLRKSCDLFHGRISQ